MGDQEKDIFNITLNKDGAAWILRFCKIVQIILMLSIIGGMISFVHNLLRINDQVPGVYLKKPELRFEYRYFPYLWVLYDLIWVVQLYYYFHFRKKIKDAVVGMDTDKFNSSFESLYRMTKISLILVILALISSSYSLFLHLTYPPY